MKLGATIPNVSPTVGAIKVTVGNIESLIMLTYGYLEKNVINKNYKSLVTLFFE